MAQETPNPASLARAAETAAEQLERLTRAAKTADAAFGKLGRSAKSSFAAIDSAASRAEESIEALTQAQRRASAQAAEYESRLSDVADALDPLATAQDALAQGASALNEALKKGATGGDQYADMLNKLGAAAKESEAEIGRYGGGLKDSGKYAEKFGSQMKDLASGLLSGQEPMTVLTNLGVGMVETFAGAALEAGGLQAALAGFGQAATVFAPWIAGLLAVGGVVALVAKSHNDHMKRIDEVNKRIDKMSGKLKDALPLLDGVAMQERLGQDGAAAFTEWLARKSKGMADYAANTKAATIALLEKQALEAKDAAGDLRRENTRIVRGATIYTGPGSLFGGKDSEGRKEYERRQGEADRNAAATQKLLVEARKTPKGVFVGDDGSSSSSSTPRDMTDERLSQLKKEIATAKTAELQAQLVLTKDIEARAFINREIAKSEAATRQVELAEKIAAIKDDKSLSGTNKKKLTDGYALLKASEDNATKLKMQAIDQDVAAQLLQSQLAARQAENAQLDQMAKFAAQMATSTEERNAIELAGLKRRQDEEVYALTASNALKVATGEITAMAAAEAELRQKNLAFTQTEAELRSQAINIARQDLERRQSGFERDLSVLQSEQQLAQSSHAAAKLERQTEEKSYQKELDRLNSITVLNGYDVDKVRDAKDDIETLKKVHANHLRALDLSDNMVTAYSDLVQALSSAAQSIIDGDVGGAISGTASVAKQLSGLTTGALSSNLTSFASYAAPIGAAVSAVTGIVGAIGQKSAEKAQAKLEALKGAVDVLRTENKTSSGSIAGALEEANSAWNQDLEYSSAMVASLRSIDNQIGSLANSLSRSITAGNLLSPSGLGLGTTTRNGSALFGLANLFLGNSKTKTELLDQGLSFNAASYADILANGISGATYADLVTTKTKKFLGVAYSTKVSTSTVSGAIDGDLLSQIAGVIQALGDGVLSAASVFGVEAAKAAEAVLGSALIDLGKLSLKDLSATEIAEVLNATFDKVADQLASAGVQGLEDLAAVGEGAFETLTRLAREYQVVDTALASLGMSFRTIGIESLSARDNLVQLFGGLDEFSSATSFFASSFLTESEQLAPVIRAVNDNLAAFGLSAKSSREEFKKVVLGLDVSTAAGAEAYKTLLSVAPAFDKVATASEDAASVLAQAAEEAASLRATQQSDAEALVSNARAALVSAYEAEASAIQETIDKWSSLEETLRDARNALDETAGAAASYAALRAQARTTAASAALGDADAAANLPDQITAFLESSADTSTSRSNYLRDVAWAKSALGAAEATAGRQKTIAEQQLEALTAQVSALTTINESVLSVAAAIAGLQSALKVLDGTYGGALVNPDREWGVNRDVNMLLARQTGYAGDFGSGGFQAWIEQQPESVKKIARDILTAQNQSYRIGFANGGAFTNGVVTRPTAFNTAVMGEAGPEAIMPLTTIGGRLGVRAANDPRLVTALERLVAVNERQAEDIADLKASNEKLQRQFATVTSGGQAMMTEAA